MWRRSIWWLMLAITCHFYVKSQEDYYNYKEYDADDECPDPVTNCDGFPYNSECAWHQNKHHIENFNFKYNFSVYNSSDLKVYLPDIINCYRQQPNSRPIKPESVNGSDYMTLGSREPKYDRTVEDGCLRYSPFCNGSRGCCEWDKITHWEMLECPDLVKCADLQCHDLWFGLGLNESEHLEHLTQLNCSKQDFRDFCSETCLAATVRWFDQLGTLADTSLRPGNEWLGFAQTTAMQGETVVASCEIEVMEDFVSAPHTAEVVTYNWAVFKDGVQIAQDDPNISAAIDEYGLIEIFIFDVQADINDAEWWCYAERLNHGSDHPDVASSDASYLKTLQNISQPDNAQRIRAIGFSKPVFPYIIADPSDNFHSQAIKALDFDVVKVSDDDGSNVFSTECSIQYEYNHRFVWQIRHVWLSILWFPNWTEHKFEHQHERFSDSNPEPDWFHEIELADVLEPLIEIHHQSGRYQTVWDSNHTMNLSINATFNIDQLLGGWAVCMIDTAVGLISESMIIKKAKPYEYRDIDEEVLLWKILGPFLAVGVLLGIGSLLYFKFIYKATVVLRVLYNPHPTNPGVIAGLTRNEAYQPVNLDSVAGTVTTGAGDYLPMDGSSSSPPLTPPPYPPYVPMRALGPDGRHLSTSETEGSPRSWVTIPIHPTIEEDYLTPSQPSTSTGHFTFSSLSTSSPRSRHHSTASSTTPCLNVQLADVDYEPFSANFTKLEGDADKILLMNRPFKVAVPEILNPYKIKASSLKFGEQIGAGNFGVVFKARSGTGEEVAAKVLKKNATFESLKELVLEASCLAMVGKHRNIVSIVAVSLDKPSPSISTEYCQHGDLKRFLVCLSRRPERDQDDVVPVFYKWAMEISRGVEYLHSKKIVHRDLAARNILLTDELMCKVSDFGLARDVGDALYYKMQSKTCLPYRWLAPEVFEHNKFSTASDVWAYAVTLYEVFSVGTQPYHERADMTAVVSYVQSGGRLETPKHMRSDVLIGLVQDVWKDVKNRPPISLIAQKIETLCEKDFSYIDMNLMRSYMDI